MPSGQGRAKAGEIVVRTEPLDLFRPQPVNLGSLDPQDGQEQPGIQRPPSDLIVAKNDALKTMLEQNTGREQARVIEELAQMLGGTVIDLSWTNLSKLRLIGLQLPYANLRAAILNNVDLSGADLRGVNLSEVLAHRLNLSGANLVGAVAVGAVLRGVDLTSASAQGVDWTDTNLSDGTITETLFPGGIFNRTALVGARWVDGSPPIVGDVTLAGPIFTDGGPIDGLFRR